MSIVSKSVYESMAMTGSRKIVGQSVTAQLLVKINEVAGSFSRV